MYYINTPREVYEWFCIRCALAILLHFATASCISSPMLSCIWLAVQLTIGQMHGWKVSPASLLPPKGACSMGQHESEQP